MNSIENLKSAQLSKVVQGRACAVEKLLPFSPPHAHSLSFSPPLLLTRPPHSPMSRRPDRYQLSREHRSYSSTSCHPPQEKSPETPASTTAPRSSLPTPSPPSTTSYPTPHCRFPLAESRRRRLPCTVSPAVLFRLTRVSYPSLMPPRTTLPLLVAGDGRNQPANHRWGRGEVVPCF
jgi:hypothetical protein